MEIKNTKNLLGSILRKKIKYNRNKTITTNDIINIKHEFFLFSINSPTIWLFYNYLNLFL